MQLKHLFFLILFGSLCVLTPNFSSYAQCHSSPDLSTMDRDFLRFLKSQNSGHKDSVVILPFFDNHVVAKDNTLYYGLPFFLYDSLSSFGSGLHHPYIAFETIKELNLTREQLIDPQHIKKVAEKLGARFVVFGSFQRSQVQTIRFMVNIYDHKEQHTLPRALDFSTDFNDSVFYKLLDTVQAAFSGLKGGKKIKYNKDNPPYLPSMQSFRYYSKGLKWAQSYDLNKLKVAKLWFENALKDSYHKYLDASLHLSRVHAMMALVQRLQKRDFSQDFLAAKQNLERAYKTPKKKPKKTAFKKLLTTRYFLAHDLFVSAITNLEAQKTAEANSLSQEALTLLPEDGLLQNLYLQTASGTVADGISITNAVCF